MYYSGVSNLNQRIEEKLFLRLGTFFVYFSDLAFFVSDGLSKKIEMWHTGKDEVY